METRVKDIADKKGVKFVEIAKKLNVSSQSVTNWTTGQRQMKIEDLSRIADALDCEITELLPVGGKYYHSYDENGIWQGIRRK